MKKIISLYQRDYESLHRYVRDEVVPGAEWVLAGEGVPTRKLNGTPCLVSGGKLYKRYDCKAGRMPPGGFVPCQEPDPITGHWPGWLLVTEDGPADQWLREAFEDGCDSYGHGFVDGWTYECCGPKIQGNPERELRHVLIPHGACNLDVEDGPVPRDFNAIRDYLRVREIEGIVWWRDPKDADCDKVKIKRKDFDFSEIRKEF